MKLSVQFLMIAILGLTAMPAGASKVEHLTVSKTVILDAPANTVWKALRIIRNSDSRQHRVMSHSGMGAQVQENFEVPVIGPVSRNRWVFNSVFELTHTNINSSSRLSASDFRCKWKM